MFSPSSVRILLILTMFTPLATYGQVQKIVPSDGAEMDLFGRQVRLNNDGTIALIGSRTDDDGVDSGSAYVFTRNDTTWTELIKLRASDAAAGDLFGEDLALSDDGVYALVGASNNRDAGFATGSAYVFMRNGSTWTEQVKLLASDSASSDRFGNAVDLNADGTYAVISATGDDGPTSFVSGSAYVFIRNGSTWTEQAKLLPSSYGPTDQYGFGSVVSISGDGQRVAVTARRIPGQIFGRVHVFVRNGTTWQQEALLVPADSATASVGEFGNASINHDGTYIVAGSNGDGPSSAGSAYFFTRNGSTWTEQVKVTASDPKDFAEFGVSVSMDEAGMRSLIASNGTAYLFERSGSTWLEQEKYSAPDSVRIARPLEISGDGQYGLVAARSDTVNGFNSGSAYAFDLSPVVLAVELIDFSAAVDGGDIHLVWETASETDNAGFYVEQRRSEKRDPDASWNRIAWISGVGTTSNAQRYRYTASGVAPGPHQFRLVQTDTDGSTEYSPVVEISVPDYNQEILQLMGPNPVRDQARLAVSLPAAGAVTVSVHDVLGRRVVVLHDGVAINRQLSLEWDARGVAPGMYFVSVTGSGFRTARSFVVAR